MSEPIDIKTKKIVPKAINQGFDKSMVHEALQKILFRTGILGASFNHYGQIELTKLLMILINISF